MAARGCDATSLSRIADEVGIRKASILYHFPNKEALRQAVLDDMLSRWNEVLPRLFLATTQDGVARFEAVMGELVDFFTADPDRARLLVREQMDRPRELREKVSQYVRPWMDVVSGYIKQGQGAGSIRADVDAEAYVIIVVNLALCSVASIAQASMLFDGEPDESIRRRCISELVRMARASLFSESENG